MIWLPPPFRRFHKPPPNAGEVMQQTQSAPALKEHSLKTSKGLRVQVPEAPAMSQREGTATIEVKGYRFAGNTAFSQETLLRLIKKRTGRLTLDELDSAAQTITRFYRDRGYLVARAYIPEQEIATAS